MPHRFSVRYVTEIPRYGTNSERAIISGMQANDSIAGPQWFARHGSRLYPRETAAEESAGQGVLDAEELATHIPVLERHFGQVIGDRVLRLIAAAFVADSEPTSSSPLAPDSSLVPPAAAEHSATTTSPPAPQS